MARYAAFLRGVSPMNLTMTALKAALEAARFQDVKTVLASGNVVFDVRRATPSTLEEKVEAAIESGVGRKFAVIVRSVEELGALLESDPYREFRLPAQAKRVVTLLRSAPKTKLALPIERDGARILKLVGRDLLSAYVPSSNGPVFMALLEKACGKEITTRTWETLQKVRRAGSV